jgi:hypothetical protein
MLDLKPLNDAVLNGDASLVMKTSAELRSRPNRLNRQNLNRKHPNAMSLFAERSITGKLLPRCLLATLLVGNSMPTVRAADPLENTHLRVEFDTRGIIALYDKATGQTIPLAQDGFSLGMDGDVVDSELFTPDEEVGDAQQRVYRYSTRSRMIRVIYELQPDWRFVSKQVSVSGNEERSCRIQRIELWRGQVAAPVTGDHRVRDSLLLRLGGGEKADPADGLFFLLQNPFSQIKRTSQRFSIAYGPDLPWKSKEPFVSDRLLIGHYVMSGARFPAQMEPEWNWVPSGKASQGAWVDAAEIEALVGCVRAFLLWKPERSVRAHIGWCENDYQIDIGTADGRAEYKRILDQAAAVGCQHVLVTPANDPVAPLSENRDAWGWENILWFNLGQKIRKDQWNPNQDPVPESVQEILDYVKSKNLKPLAYVYPSLPFMQKPEWTSWVPGGHPGGYLGADTGQRSFQDWLVGKLVDFSKQTGASGFSFDHWWIAYDETVSSRYAQWDGCRRVLTELRRRLPDVVIDGRQQYYGFGPWTWVAGTYPHPLASDEQPESFRSFPDLHWDRGSADRERRIAWWYRMTQLTPVEIMPGYMTHQTGRNDEQGQCPRTRFRAADWDLLGWKFSVISSIGTAPFNHIVNFLPARDEREFKAFSAADQKWMRDWFDWTDQNMEVLRNVKPILGPPQIGRVDGWAAFKGNRSFVFLFNPNYRELTAEFTLDRTIGLNDRGPFVLKQLYPDAEKGRLLAAPGKAFWSSGDKANLPMPATEALVLEISPAPDRIEQPVLLGAAGQAVLDGNKLTLGGVLGEAGTERMLAVAMPADRQVSAVTVNGTKAEFQQIGTLLSLKVRFAGARFSRCQQVGEFDPGFTGGIFRAETIIPARVFRQIEARKRAWPVDYSETERQAAYLNSDRLLLFVNVAEPDDEKMKVSLTVDSESVPVRPAYTSVVRSNPRNTFVGWRADLTDLKPEVKHSVAVELPALKPGQFQGLFFDTVEAEFTKHIVTQ